MCRGFCAFVLLLACTAAISSRVSAQIVDHNDFATVVAESSSTIRLTTGDANGVEISVRFLAANGNPIPGLAVSFLVDECSTSGIGPANCPPTSVYGHFSPAMTAPVTTDSNGVATGHPFIAG